MAPNQQTETFTVPVGTRLSHGIELEMLVAYLHTSDVDPDGANSENLAPILRVDAGDTGNGNNDDVASQETVEGIVEEHIRRTLRNHGIGVNAPEPAPISEDIPVHLHGLDRWDVTTDISVREGPEESELTQDKPGKYRWLGLELRSPACWDVPRAYDEIRFVVNLMKSKYRVRLNPSCGLHAHVANGPRFFDAKTLKRAGAFFFAADPMLSRLHAPWRRIGLYTPSIRYISRLARLDKTKPIHAQMPTDRAAALFREQRPPSANPIYLPVVPWSDRSREEIDFGGKANGGMVNWERYANERVRDGPHITLSERPPTPGSSMGSEDPIPHPPSLSPSSFSSFPSSDDGNDDEGGAHYRRFLRVITAPSFRATCFRRYNHKNPEKLSLKEQYTVLVMLICQYLFGHWSVNLLSDEQYYQLTVECAPFIEVGRSSWEWDRRANEFTLKDAPIGTVLEHPRPLTLKQTNGEEVVHSLQALAAIQEAEGEQRASQQSEDDTGAPDHDDDGDGDGDDDDDDDIAGDEDRDVWRGIYYDWIDRLMAQPTFPLDNIESLLAQFPDGGSASGSSGSSGSAAGKAKPARVFKVPSTSGSESSTNASARVFKVPSTTDSQSSTDASARVFKVPSTTDSQSSTNASTRVFKVPSTSGSELSGSSTNASARVFKVPTPRATVAVLVRPQGGPCLLAYSSAGDNDGNGGNGGDEFAFLFPKTTAGGGFESLPGTPGSSDSSPDGSGDFNPPAFPAYMAPQSHKSDSEASDEGSPPSSPFLSNVSSAHRNSRITSGPKLHPHDIYQLSDSYLYHISRRYGFGGPDWRRIEWLPYPGGPPDPGQGHPNGGPESMRHAVTDTRAGLATILGVDSGAAVAELLIANDRDDRANYNFGAYDSETLNLPGWKRTLEFREAGGSLDPDWIITWASICVGILRFCRDASVIDFITVLERVVREEERQRTADPESDDEGMYDVCDLLEDMCLFAEATTIRERERKLGPPR